MVSGNFATDAFTTAAFSMRFFGYITKFSDKLFFVENIFLSLSADTPIAEFDKVPFTKGKVHFSSLSSMLPAKLSHFIIGFE